MKAIQRRTTFITLLALTVLCSTSAASPAATQSRTASHIIPGHFLYIIDFLLDLDLTLEQKSDLQEILSAAQETLRPLIADMHDVRSALDETFLGEEIDTSKASAQIEEMSRLKAEITAAGLHALLRGAQVLTPEQRQTIIDARDEWKNCFMRIRNLVFRLFGPDSVE